MMKMSRIMLMVVLIFLVCLNGCVSVQKGVSNNLFPELSEQDTAAVSYIPEASSGDITALGNLWRDRIEKILAARGVVIKARKDIVALIEDIETFDTGFEEKDIWKQAGTDIIVLGNYTILAAEKPSSPRKIRVVVKAYRTSDLRLVSAEEFVEKLDSSWVSLASKITGNVHQEKFEVVSSNSLNNKKPLLSASLNKKNSCFAAGQSVKINIKTDPGAYIYIYIFNLTADGNVSLLYPNRWLKNKPLDFQHFVFPPPDSNVIDLVLYPLEKNGTSKESFKIVASKTKLDFSFLPVPENQVFAGANGSDIKRMTKILNNTENYSQTTLTYFVGSDCN